MCIAPLLLAAALSTPAVLIDPGHGGMHDGAIGICGIKEKDVTLGVSLELGRLLNASGRVQAWLTRDHDATIELSTRAKMGNRLQASLFVSIHANASTNSEAHGVETFFLSQRAANRQIAALARRENGAKDLTSTVHREAIDALIERLSLAASHTESQRFAVHLQRSLSKDLSTSGRGVLQAPFVVLKNAHMPSALVEVGFLTHPNECEQLADAKYQRSIARALAHAILRHLALENVALAQSVP